MFPKLLPTCSRRLLQHRTKCTEENPPYQSVITTVGVGVGGRAGRREGKGAEWGGVCGGGGRFRCASPGGGARGGGGGSWGRVHMTASILSNARGTGTITNWPTPTGAGITWGTAKAVGEERVAQGK